MYLRQFRVSIDEIKTILSLEFRRKLVDLSEKICLIKNLKMSLRNHRQIRLDKYANSNRCMERLAELVLFLDWFLVNPEFLDGVRLSAPLFRSSISYLFVRLPLRFAETHFYPGMEIEKLLKKITERFTPLLNTTRLILDPTRQPLRKPFYCTKNSVCIYKIASVVAFGQLVECQMCFYFQL